MIKEYLLKDGSRRFMYSGYYGTNPLTGKKIITKKRGFKTKKEAELAEARFRVSLEQDDYRTTSKKKVTFTEAFEGWNNYYRTTVKASTHNTQMIEMNVHVLPFFGHLQVDKITIALCQQFVTEQHAKLINYHNSVNLASSVLDYAKRMKYIKENPMTDVLKPKRRKGKQRKNEYWDRDELNHFFKCLDVTDYNDNLKPLYRLLAYTGARKGEIMALRWSDIDFINRTLTIERTLAVTAEGLVFQPTKTGAGMRTISIDSETLRIIKSFEPTLKRNLMFFGNKHQGNEQLIFCNERNEPLYLDYPNHYLDKIIKHFEIKSIHIHGFRHTHCTLLFEAGASIKEVQVRLGHSDIKTTMEIYNHVTKKKAEETSDKFAEYMAEN